MAAWRFAEWGKHHPGETVEDWTASLAAEAASTTIPQVVLALDGAAPVGSAALVEHDIDGDPRTPWLASVYVDPPARRRGIAAALVGEIECRAAAQGVERLYLFTVHSQALYARLGWRDLERRDYQDRRIQIMHKRLG